MDLVDGVQQHKNSRILNIVSFLPREQQATARRILEYLTGNSKIEIVSNMEVVINGIPVSGLNTVDL